MLSCPINKQEPHIKHNFVQSNELQCWPVDEKDINKPYKNMLPFLLGTSRQHPSIRVTDQKGTRSIRYTLVSFYLPRVV